VAVDVVLEQEAVAAEHVATALGSSTPRKPFSNITQSV
jgi:hypothetical protein